MVVWSRKTLQGADALIRQADFFSLEPRDQANAAISMRVSVVDYPDGRLAIRYKGVPLAYPAERFCERSAPWRSLG